MSDDYFEEERPEYHEERKSSGGCLKGCLIIVLVISLIVLIAGFWVYKNRDKLFADLGSFVVGMMIDQSDWDKQEKSEVKAEFDRLIVAFKEGKIADENFEIVVNEIVKSPLWTTMVVASIEKKYVENSGLTEEEKEAGRGDMRRFLRGMVTEKLSEEDFDAAIGKLAVKNDKDLWEMKESATDEELRELFALVKEKVDAAEIPPEVEDVDPSEEMKRIIDKALGEGVPEAEPVEEVAE